MKKDMKIVIFGAGAIGQSVGGWIAPHHENLFFLDRGDVAKTMKEKGINLYEQNKKDEMVHVDVKVIEDISEAKDADVIALGVKNFSLDAVAKLIKKNTKDDVIIIGMQNGRENQEILPKYFKNVIYCVVGYNAWFDEPGVLGYQKKGPLIFGTAKNELMEEMNEIAEIFNKGVETVVVDHLQDAVHSKMIVNLTNSLTTLTGLGFQEITDMDLFQKLLTNLLNEGVQIAKAGGFKECKIGGMPPWRKMWMGANLPRFITRGMINKNIKKMVMSSMAQDIIQRGSHDSEIDTINGYFVELADKNGLKAPFNRSIYSMCKEEFARDKFSPLDVKDVWAKVSANL
ncbi:MAG: 2-dehydropantoate 2-reductase [bacterium]|nr:2-dehydropantoate 2-reductase [bacterium]